MIGIHPFRKHQPSDRLMDKIGDRFARSELAAIEQFGTGTTIPAGEVFVTEGQIGREVLLILDGTAAVARSGEEVAVVGAGDFVGERAVLLGEPRNASLIATTDLEVIVYSVAEFRSLIYRSYSLDIKLRELVKTRG